MMNRQDMIGVLCGMLLGDGNAQINPKGKNAYLQLGHQESQIDYLKYKMDILSNLCGMSLSKSAKTNCYHSKSKCHPWITTVKKWFYGSNGKQVSNKILYRLNKLGLAIWYMDDGHLAYIKKKGKIRGREVKIYTCSFDYDSHLRMVEYFKNKWDIQWRIGNIRINKGKYKGRRYWNLATGAREGAKFFKLIAPYIIPSMAYKLDFKYTYSSYAGRPFSEWSVIQSVLGSNVKSATEMIAPL